MGQTLRVDGWKTYNAKLFPWPEPAVAQWPGFVLLAMPGVAAAKMRQGEIEIWTVY
jgi:hypothetical protein